MILLTSGLVAVCLVVLYRFLKKEESLDEAHKRAMAKFDQVLAEERSHRQTWQTRWDRLPQIRPLAAGTPRPQIEVGAKPTFDDTGLTQDREGFDEEAPTRLRTKSDLDELELSDGTPGPVPIQHRTFG